MRIIATHVMSCIIASLLKNPDVVLPSLYGVFVSGRISPYSVASISILHLYSLLFDDVFTVTPEILLFFFFTLVMLEFMRKSSVPLLLASLIIETNASCPICGSNAMLREPQ